MIISDMMSETYHGGCADCPVIWKNFRHLSESELRLIDENRYEAAFKPGEILVKQGTPASNELFLASGIAKKYLEGINGRNFISGILIPGSPLMGPGAYTGARYTCSVSALTQVKACFVSFDVFRKLVRENSLFAESLIEDLTLQLGNTGQRMVSLTQKKMAGRLAELLLHLADDIFGAEEFGMVLSRQEIGDMTNMVKESVVRILNSMEKDGLIRISASRIAIIDREKLLFISENG